MGKYSLIPALFLLLANDVSAQWSGDPTANTPVCTATDSQISPKMISDGDGGAILSWTDLRTGFNGTDYDVYAQRMSADGIPLWTLDGIVVNNADNNQIIFGIVPDNAGGAIISWTHHLTTTNSHVYAQRINSDGTLQWGANGVAICTAQGAQGARMVADGNGGAIIVWADQRNGSNNDDIYAQRINASGVVQWNANGVAVCNAPDLQEYISMITDDAGGAIITWKDDRNGLVYDEIYAQRISAAGVAQWTADGTLICAASSDPGMPNIATDGSGGAIVAYVSGENLKLHAQRISASGNTLWTPNGILVFDLDCVGCQGQIPMISDNAGGVILAFAYYTVSSPNNTNMDISLQRINSAGVCQWTAAGVAVASEAFRQMNPALIPNGSGGAIIAWDDSRFNESDYNIYTQSVNSQGLISEIQNGVIVCVAANNQRFPQIIANGAGSSIIAWTDFRNGLEDIYITLMPDHELGLKEEQEDKPVIYPNPANDVLYIRLSGTVKITSVVIYDLSGKAVKSLKEMTSKEGLISIDISDLERGCYLICFNGRTENIFVR